MKFSNIISSALLATSVSAGDHYYPASLIHEILSLDVNIDINIKSNIDIINHKCHPHILNLDYYLCIEHLIGYPEIDPINIKASVDEVAEVKSDVDLRGNSDIKAKADVLELAKAKTGIEL
jgi:hypothetical protein